MKGWRRWPETLLAVLIVALDGPGWLRNSGASGLAEGSAWTAQRKLDAREETRNLWYHGYNNYMRHAFPLDELSPISCTGRGPDWEHPDNIATNDVSGNFSLTLIDVLDTLVVLGDRQGFDTAVRNTIDWVSFDVNTKPQVFETTIRVMGGLLSGHIFANQTDHPFFLPWYRGELLAMAHDLGKRLLPAFNTPTGIPYARLNLRHGLKKGETAETCTAGGGSLILEFATLGRLTGDDRFEKAAYKAFFALWNRKSDIGLVGNTINTWSGLWTSPEVTGIGAGIDSFYEYALKWYVLSGEVEFLDVWNESYAAIMRYARAADGFWYRNVNIHTGDVAYYTVDSLSAFWPGLQVLAGDVQNAIKSHMIYWNLWRRHAGLPEVFDINYRVATSLQYPLRPEFIESTWYLYRATRDPFYLDVGERVLRDIGLRSKVECGLTGIQDLVSNARVDRMESFALSETLKYLFLLFDEENPLHHDDSNYVFTTEGHILSLGKEHLRPLSTSRRKLRRVESPQCPAYAPYVHVSDDWDSETGLVRGIRSRPDIDFTRELVGIVPEQVDKDLWTPYGWCEKPKVEIFSFDFILSPNGDGVPEDVNPGPSKLTTVPDGYLLQNISGIRTHIVTRLDGKGYDVTKLGPHSVLTGQMVYVNDSALRLAPLNGQGFINDTSKPRSRDPDVILRLFTDNTDPMFQVQPGVLESSEEVLVTAYTALFGGDLSAPDQFDEAPLRFGHGDGNRVVRDDANPFGCLAYQQSFLDDIILVRRGVCTFLEKLLRAKAAGAAGVVVISDENSALNPSAEANEITLAGDISDVAIVVIAEEAGKVVINMLDMIQAHGVGDLMLTVEPEGRSGTTDSGGFPQNTKEWKEHDNINRVLYLNGHPLLNTRLLI